MAFLKWRMWLRQSQPSSRATWKSRPAKRSHSAAHKSAGCAKVADIRNGYGNHLSNFNGHANRPIGLSKASGHLVSQHLRASKRDRAGSSRYQARPGGHQGGSAGQLTFNLCAAETFWLIKYLKMLNDLRAECHKEPQRDVANDWLPSGTCYSCVHLRSLSLSLALSPLRQPLHHHLPNCRYVRHYRSSHESQSAISASRATPFGDIDE